MSAPTIITPLKTPRAQDDYDRAAALIRGELGGVDLAPQQKNYDAGTGVREHKAALIRAVTRSIHAPSVTEAFRIVDAAYPYFSLDSRCTEEAVTAACGPRYGGLAGYRPSTQQILRAEARSILTDALDATGGAR